MIYFAMNARWESPSAGTWTAISRVPFLKAIALYPKGDCWHGGGLFLSNHTFWLNNAPNHREPLIENTSLRPDRLHKPKKSFGGECPSVYYHRLPRDGWRHLTHHTTGPDSTIDTFDKTLPSGWILRKHAHATLTRAPGKGVYYDTHELLHSESNYRQKFPDWEWAEYATHRLLWATHGRIFAAKLTKSGPSAQTELHDFNNMTFQAIKAPY